MRGRPASRASRFGESATLAVSKEAAKLRAQGRRILDFGVGEPDFPTPENIREAARRAMDEGRTRYTPTAGIPELRAAVAERYRRLWGADVDPSRVVVGCGGKHLLWEAAYVLFEEGDEVLIPTPAWVSFPEQVKMAGATPILVPSRFEEGFVPRIDDLRAAITPRTKGIVLNTPVNPTGAVLPRRVLQEIADLALERDLYVVFDETYDAFVYDGAEHWSLAAHAGLKDRLVAVHTVSKTYAMTGWRIGFCVAPPEVADAIEKVQSQMTSNPTSIAQWAALEAITGPQDSVARMRAAFAERRAILLEGLAGLDGVRIVPPAGAYYAMPDVSEPARRRGLAGGEGLARALLHEAGVATIPGEPFGAPGTVRLSYACATETVREGVAALRAFFSAR